MDRNGRHQRPVCENKERKTTVLSSVSGIDKERSRSAAHSCQRTRSGLREDFDKYPLLYDRLERVLCPRVHFKIWVFDCAEVYIGSANLTGAGIGMKAETTRNFEAGILTNQPEIVEQAMNLFDNVWIGKMCKTCKRRMYCADPVG